jgi:hypothetical protein
MIRNSISSPLPLRYGHAAFPYPLPLGEGRPKAGVRAADYTVLMPRRR